MCCQVGEKSNIAFFHRKWSRWEYVRGATGWHMLMATGRTEWGENDGFVGRVGDTLIET